MPELDTAPASAHAPVPPPTAPRAHARGQARRGRGGQRGGRGASSSGASSVPATNGVGSTLDAAAEPFAPSASRGARGGRGGRGRGRGAGAGRGRGGASRGGAHALNGNGHGGPASAQASVDGDGEAQAAAAAAAPAIAGGRRKKFGGKITGGELSSSASASASATPAIPAPPTEYADLRSRLIAELSSGAYDCSICYSVISTKAAVWSCTSCFSILHLSCARTWALQSVEKAEAQNAMQEDAEMRGRKGTWRCPGCQYARAKVPSEYRCWDGQMSSPHPGGGKPPHSCGRPCARAKCSHGCAAGLCHPGPCPPCPVSINHRCFCGAQEIAVRCSQLSKPSSSSLSSSSTLPPERGISCGAPCNSLLSCGAHRCARTCHAGPCEECAEMKEEKCYCGREERRMRCGEGTLLPSSSESGGEEWMGRWNCERVCGKAFDCGKHACKQTCHPLEKQATPCPFSPANVSTCPCGATPVSGRTSCSDPVPTCGRPCPRLHASCGHACGAACHHGPCAPCTVPTTSPCRCGETKQTLPCAELQRRAIQDGEEQEVLCQTLCRALRHCGKHECRRVCCPLYFQAKSKAKRRPTAAELEEQDPAHLHACDVPCQKPLSCGRHKCPIGCHRGPCPPCLLASFEELSCHCGKTVLEPPVACGTQIQCNFPCTRPSNCAYGHPKQQHNCHEEEPCPPCVYLVEKPCQCAKHNLVQNVPCHRQRVTCGAVCGATLGCGYHRCTATCHPPGECAPCTQPCGKPRPRCGHPCTQPCHAPAACPETEACAANVTLECACGNLQQRARCGASLHSASSERKLKCTDACALAARNANLAVALGLNPADKAAVRVEYEPWMIEYCRENKRLVGELEAVYTDLIRSSRHGIVLPPSGRTQREFEQALAKMYNLGSESLDGRSVSLRRQQFSKIPSPTLLEAASAAPRSSARPTALGQLQRRAEAPPAAPLNALLLERVFGHDAASLQALLSRAVPVPFSLRWLGDEDVLVSAADSARLLACLGAVRLLARAEHAAAHVVAVAVDALTKRILRRDDGATKPTAAAATAQSLSRGTSSSGSSTPTSRPGGWAAVASGAAAAAAPAPARPSAWGAPARTQTALRPPLGSAPAAVVHIPAVPAPVVPDDWQEE